MKNIIRDKAFWILFVCMTVIFLVMSINGSSTYQAKSRILFVPKNEITARNINQIVENAKQIPLSLSFYNKVVELNSYIEDMALELPDAKRKEFWNSKIETRQVNRSGVVEITIFDDSLMQAELISDQTVAGILTVMGNYYGAGSNLDMRVIDKSVLQETTRVNYWQAGAVSLTVGLLSGIALSLAFSFMFDFLEKGNRGKNGSFKSETSIFPKFVFPGIAEKKTVSTEKKGNIFNFKTEDEASLIRPIEPKKFGFFGSREKKSSAPSNLPIAEEFDMKMAAPGNIPIESDLKDGIKYDNIQAQEEEFVLDMGGMKKDLPGKASEVMADADSKREATPEEVKMRLNKLLSGDTSK